MASRAVLHGRQECQGRQHRVSLRHRQRQLSAGGHGDGHEDGDANAQVDAQQIETVVDSTGRSGLFICNISSAPADVKNVANLC